MKKIFLLLYAKSLGIYLNGLSYIYPDKAKVKAYALFSQPRKGKLKKETLPSTLHYSIQEIFDYKKDTFHTYKWEGNDDIILLVHGWESNSNRWKKTLQHLKNLPNTIIAIDAPAHGLSDGKEFNAPKYAEFINIVAKKYQPKIVIGHSVGGVTLAYYLHQFKDPYIEKVVLLGSPSEFKILSDNFVRLLGLNHRIKKSLESYYAEKFGLDIHDFSGHKFAQHFTQKAFIAHDDQDRVVSVKEGRKYAEAWKNAVYLETVGLGHSMHDSDLYQKIIRFITEA